jgi:hypothetical protein
MQTHKLEGVGKLSFDRVRKLRVRAAMGSVSIVGTPDRPTLEVSEVEGKPLLVRHDGETLELGYDEDWPIPLGWLVGKQRPRVVASAAVPTDCAVEVEAVSAAVMVSGVHAPVVARGVNGEITLAGLRGQVKADTVSGTVQAQDLAGDLWVNTISGAVTLVDGSGSSVHAQSVSGRITLDLEAREGSDIRLNSASGEVTVRVPYDSDLAVQLQSTSGQIASAFPELERGGLVGMRLVQGELGAGTGRLRVNTVTGHITLLRREPGEELGAAELAERARPARAPAAAADTGNGLGVTGQAAPGGPRSGLGSQGMATGMGEAP